MAEREPYPSELDLRAAFRSYLEDAPTQVRPAELAHQFATTHPHRRSPIGPWGLTMALRPAWILLLLAALLAAVVGAAFIGSRLRQSTPPRDGLAVALVPTGVEVLSPGQARYGEVVADGNGILWAHVDDGRLVRFDPTTGSERTWTVSDDAAFASFELMPARSGGVWLIGARTLRWFDGDVFRTVIETPGSLASDLTIATEAADGSIWAAALDGTVLHWDGSSWSTLVAPRASTAACEPPDAVCYPGAIAVDAAGRVWVGWIVYPIPPNVAWVSRYDGSAWAVFDDGMTANRVESITQQPDGSIWAITDGGLARFNGQSWIDETGSLSSHCTSPPAFALDGAAWCLGPGSSEGAAAVWRYDGSSWASKGEAGGAPGDSLEAVVPTTSGTYVAVTESSVAIYGIADGRWERAWSAAADPSGAGGIASTESFEYAGLLAPSRDELLATGERGVRRFTHGAWSVEPIDPAHPGSVDDLVLAPDGTVWAAGAHGVAYRRDGRWVVVDSTSAGVITIGRDGVAWVAGGASGCDIWTVRSSRGTWIRTQLTTGRLKACVGGGVLSMAVDGRGTLWVGTGGFVVDGLASYADGRWSTYHAFAGLPDTTGVSVLGIAPNGDPWIASEDWTAHFDGTAWTVIRGPEGTAAADRALGLSSPAWNLAQTLGDQGPVAGRALAPDGTVFALQSWTGRLFRVPASIPSP
jgi:sugar lactone lactonase YvrE